MSRKRFTQSPMRLPLTHGPRFKVVFEDETVEVDRESTDEDDLELVRGDDDDPDPGVVAMLHLAGDSVVQLKIKGLGSSSVEDLTKWIEENQTANQLTVDFASPDIYRAELRNLARLADRENLEIEINLRDDV